MSLKGESNNVGQVENSALVVALLEKGVMGAFNEQGQVLRLPMHLERRMKSLISEHELTALLYFPESKQTQAVRTEMLKSTAAKDVATILTCIYGLRSKQIDAVRIKSERKSLVNGRVLDETNFSLWTEQGDMLESGQNLKNPDKVQFWQVPIRGEEKKRVQLLKAPPSLLYDSQNNGNEMQVLNGLGLLVERVKERMDYQRLFAQINDSSPELRRRMGEGVMASITIGLNTGEVLTTFVLRKHVQLKKHTFSVRADRFVEKILESVWKVERLGELKAFFGDIQKIGRLSMGFVIHSYAHSRSNVVEVYFPASLSKGVSRPLTLTIGDAIGHYTATELKIDPPVDAQKVQGAISFCFNTNQVDIEIGTYDLTHEQSEHVDLIEIGDL